MRGWASLCGILLLAGCTGPAVSLPRPPDSVPGVPASPRPVPAAPRPPPPAPAPEVPEPPPSMVGERPAYLVLIPGSEVYHAPDYPVGLYFYNGLWFTRHEGRWFFSTDFGGPWTYLSPRGVPPALQHLPAGQRGGPAPPKGGPG